MIPQYSVENLEGTLSSITLKASTFESLKLSPNDWLIPSTSMITCIYFYDIHQWSSYHEKANGFFIECDRLITSLEQLLNYYPFLAGILKVVDPDHHTYVEHDANQGGILFVSTSVNIPLTAISLSMNDVDNQMIIPPSLQLTNPFDPTILFHIRHTRFSCGSVALGISLNHQIADAHSLFQLINDWTHLYRNLNYQPSVCHQRSLLEPDQTEIEMRQRSNSEFHHRRSLAIHNDLPTSIVSTQKNIIKIFRFSADELERMKSDSLSHLSSNVTYLSTFEVLTAHLHRHVMLARQHPSSMMTRIFIATNIRPRLSQPSIPLTYFGNAIMFSYLEVIMSTVIEDDHLSSIASQIHHAVEENDTDDIRTTLAWVRSASDPRNIMPTCKLNDMDFTISAWNKMGMYTNSDFEFNVHPCRILLPPETQFNGGAILLSTEKQDTSIDVCLGLEIHQMERLENNVDFRKYRFPTSS